MKFFSILPVLLTIHVNAQNHPQPITLFERQDSGDKVCYRIPSLIKAKGHTLLAVADQRMGNCGDLIYNDDINLVLRRSTDGGKTWQPMRTIVDFAKGRSASDASMVLNKKTGEIYLFYNYMDLKNAKGIYKFHFITSKDNGASWSTPQDITQQISPADTEKDFKFITSGRQVYTKNGTIMGTLVHLKKGVFIFESKDGKNWKVSETPLSPADESNIVELSNQNILVNSRVNSYGKRRLYTMDRKGTLLDSRDSVTDPGCNGSMITIRRYCNNFVLFSNLNNSKSRENLGIRYSTDGGKTWSGSYTVYTGSSAYSSMAEINRKEIGIFFENDDYSKISFAKVALKDLLKKQ